METQVLGLSVDSEPCLKAWAESLGGITYPLLSDFYPHGRTAQMYGVLRPEGFSERAIFVIDKRGRIRYVDVHNIDEQPDNELLFRVLSELEPEASARFRAKESVSQNNELAWKEPQAEIVLYCTPWCPDCKKARNFFTEKGVSYVEVDISRNRDAARLIRSWNNGLEITPTIKFKGTIINQFNQERLEQLLTHE